MNHIITTLNFALDLIILGSEYIVVVVYVRGTVEINMKT